MQSTRCILFNVYFSKIQPFSVEKPKWYRQQIKGKNRSIDKRSEFIKPAGNLPLCYSNLKSTEMATI